jgi:hypothetical protein
VGILCLTPGALRSTWIHYEAGALAKTRDALVCSLLIGVDPSEVKYPLAQFQQTKLERQDFRRLLDSINKSVDESGGRALPDAVLERLFDLNWQRLVDSLSSVMAMEDNVDVLAGKDIDSGRAVEELDMMEETIGIVLLKDGGSGWSIEELIPAMFQLISPGAQISPGPMLAMFAGRLEKNSLAKLIRMGFVRNVNSRYFLTDLGGEHFRVIADRFKDFQWKV